MQRLKSLLLISLTLVLMLLTVARAEDVCKVTDPTGTPLNVRAAPNGRIISTLKNGREVYIEEMTTDDKGKPWVKVSLGVRGGKKLVLGWVLREFISCYKR
jgi:hypothetical protein